MSLRDDLIAAKALIDTPEKWIKGGFRRDNRLCVRAACSVAERKPSFLHDTRSEKALMAALGCETLAGLARYNDHPDTTHADVMALFDRAIAATPSIDMSKQGANPRDNHEEISK